MLYLNDYDIDRTILQYVDHPVLGPATKTLANLVDWTNSNSDGWAYWEKPVRAAEKLQRLIQGDGIRWFYGNDAREDATPEAYKAALTPIKAFRTRQGADFTILEVAR